MKGNFCFCSWLLLNVANNVFSFLLHYILSSYGVSHDVTGTFYKTTNLLSRTAVKPFWTLSAFDTLRKTDHNTISYKTIRTELAI